MRRKNKLETISKFEMIPLDRILISTSNVRADEFFGDEEDQELVESIGSFGVLQPIIVRAVGDKYEVIIGRRRFLSAKESGLTEIPCIIKDVHDDEALDISLTENLFRKDLDPVTTGRALKRRIKRSGISLREYAKRIGKPASTLSDFIKMTDLSPDMQNEVQAGTVTFRDALKVSRIVPLEKQEALAREAREGGHDSFKKTLDRISQDQEKRGAPPGLLIIRINFGKKSPDYNKLRKLAEGEGIDLSEYCHKILKEHIKSLKG